LQEKAKNVANHDGDPVRAKQSKRKKSRPPVGDLLFFGSPCWARPTLASLVATSHLSVASSGQMASSPCGLDDRIAAISSLRTVNIANHAVLMVQTLQEK
jgi:hypothetical protein